MDYWDINARFAGDISKFALVLWEYDANDQVEYLSCHMDQQAATDDPNWKIKKFTYANNLTVRMEGFLIGSYDDRANLDWRTDL